MLNVTFQDILMASARLKGRVNETPLIPSLILAKETGVNAWFKLENRQLTGSFKARGAINKLDLLTKEQLQTGVIAASAGNHAQGLAYAASLQGVSAKIVVPTTTPEVKKQGILRYGGELVVYGDLYDDAEAYAFQLAEESGRTFVNAFEDGDVIAGQGTAALEAFLAEPDFEAVIVPAGGGGLLSGAALVAKAVNPNIKVIGVQTEASPPWYHSFKAGKLVPVSYQKTIAEGLHGGITKANFDLVQKVVDDFVVVTEASVAEAMVWMAKEHHEVVEGSGAVGVAALRSGLLPEWEGKKVLVIVSGGNVDFSRLVKLAVNGA